MIEKPRIKWTPPGTLSLAGVFQCKGYGGAGYGRTPTEAFDQWLMFARLHKSWDADAPRCAAQSAAEDRKRREAFARLRESAQVEPKNLRKGFFSWLGGC